MDAARAQVGRTWYFAKADARLPKGRYFIDDLLGCTVKDAGTGAVYGTITAVDQRRRTMVYTVRDAVGAEHLFPAVPEVPRPHRHRSPHRHRPAHPWHVYGRPSTAMRNDPCASTL